MTLFLSDEALAARRSQLQDPRALGGLAASLQAELHAALDVPIPDGKSRLTRSGGRCASCTVLLDFDPREPHAHTCPSCGTVYSHRVHHEWWLMNAHLWTAEQCTRAAALAYLLNDDAAARRADEILDAYTVRYASWPNRDNALGPTRPFFSTYLESIWLLHLATALDLREKAEGRVGPQRMETRQRLIVPSARLIASFDEGRSNRQVWHRAALLAATGLVAGGPLEMPALQKRAASSLVHLLREGLHTDGSWYEGENYHLFAHRGLLTAVTLAESSGVVLPSDLLERFHAGFSAPFRTMLPDGTFPARRDSQYGVSLRQYRTADWLECGLARTDTPALRAALASIYDTWPETGHTGRATSTADAERNQPSVRLTRADCSWRALLLAPLDLPPLEHATPQSELLEGQGFAVFRRNAGQFWIGLDYGDPGDGHGHPDRLNLVIATRESRWLDDVGTGSYTSPTLAWYRSSMAHNAPFVNGHDQGAAAGALIAHDERGNAGWVSASFTDPHSGAQFIRTVVVMAGYVVDELLWQSQRDVTVDSPMQAMVELPDGHVWSPMQPGTEQDAMLDAAAQTPILAGHAIVLALRGLPSPTRRAENADVDFACHVLSCDDAVLWCAATIGAPAGTAHGMLALRQHGRAGRSVRVIAARGSVHTIALQGDTMHVVFADGSTDRHERAVDGWRILTERDDTAVTLAGGRLEAAERKPPRRTRRTVTPAPRPLPLNGTFVATFDGADAYRPTEETWKEAGAPTANLSIRRTGTTILLAVHANLFRAPAFAAACAENPLDNELPDINSDGVQLHWRSAVTGGWNSVIAVPDGTAVRLTVAEGSLDGMAASWHLVDRGYVVDFVLPWPASVTALVIDCCVNDRPDGRERRRGQLVLSGARGESAYLRGARQSSTHALHFDLLPDLW